MLNFYSLTGIATTTIGVSHIKRKSFTNIPGYVIKTIYITNGSHIKQDIIFKLKNEFY